MRRAADQTWAPYCVNYLVIFYTISLSHSSGVIKFRFVSFRFVSFRFVSFRFVSFHKERKKKSARFVLSLCAL